MFNPVSTYRIQFHKGFNFKDFINIIPYLNDLGIKTIYASPIFQTAPGSTHGYDVVDPLNINPEIGTLNELYEINKTLKQLNISWLQDIVPNHMAFDKNNKWLMDVLERGKRSVYYSYFDIISSETLYNGKLMIPFLGSALNETLNNNEIQLNIKDGRFILTYGEEYYPINLKSYITILQTVEISKNNFFELINKIKELESIEDESFYTGKLDGIYNEFSFLVNEKENFSYLQTYIEKLNSNPKLLAEIIDSQEYQLCHWQDTNSQINFRRFFTVNGLICLNIQDENVFNHYHQLIKKLVDDGVFQGLRVDHIDGLYDPKQYLERLRNLVGNDVYIIVEKILEWGESFPSNWPVQGNTGYDFLSFINNLSTNVESKKSFSNFYKTLTNEGTTLTQKLFNKKSLILHEYMAGELDNLTNLFFESNLVDYDVLKDISIEKVKASIAKILIYFPVYRFYGSSFPLEKQETEALSKIFNQIINDNQELRDTIKIIRNILIEEPLKDNSEYNSKALHFYQRLMQFTGPLMAKGMEDTLMYTYNRFINHNEVGDSPASFGINADEYHQLMLERQKSWPLSMNSTSTHDTKRGEDVRARLNVLTDLSELWIEKVKEWTEINSTLKVNNAPDENDEYFIYQTIIGAHPMPGEDEDDFCNRLQEYLVKGLREAKRKSNWAEPNEDYEEATKNFVKALLDSESKFKESFTDFHKIISDFGIINSLIQIILKFTCPGVPDLYQGCELWDFSLVDPDNRRPVDYIKRRNFLEKQNKTVLNQTETWDFLWQNRYNANIKSALTNTLLIERKNSPNLFLSEYIPLETKGKYKNNVLAYARKLHDQWFVVVLPLQLATINDNIPTVGSQDWENTQVLLPGNAPSVWKHILSGKENNFKNFINLNEIFKIIPMVLLTNVLQK